MRRRSVIMWGAAALLLPADSHAAEDAYTLRKLRDHAGKTTSLMHAAAGERLVVVVLKGTWCQVCIRQLQRLAEIKAKLDALGARVVGLTHESNDKARKAAAKLPFPILSDPGRDVLAALGVWRQAWGHPLPAMVVFDRCGDERGRQHGRAPGQRPEASLLALLHKLDKDPEDCGTPRV